MSGEGTSEAAGRTVFPDIESDLIKVEILFTRKCSLGCPGCAMVKDMEEISIPQWDKGLKALADLKCPFIAVYGAEPLSRFDDLCRFLHLAHNKHGLTSTVITSGTQMTEKKLDLLYDVGLRSLSVSVDGLDASVVTGHQEVKSLAGDKWVREFQQKAGIRDVQVCMTVNAKNFRTLPDYIRYYNDLGIWVSFDILHYERGFPGGKTAPRELVTDLLFSPHTVDFAEVRSVFAEILAMKKAGALIFPTESVIRAWMEEKYVFDLGWQCAGWPHFLTVDCDGTVRHGCDDMHVIFPGEHEVKIWNLVEEYEYFKEAQQRTVKALNCRCFWSTHFSSKELWGKGGSVDYFRHLTP